MGEQTGIRWTDATDNCIKVRNPRTGKFGGFYCVKISPGCTNCYAATMVGTGRFGEPIPYVAGPNAPELYLDEEMLEGWARKMRPKRRFVSSMTDIAGEFVPDDWYYAILDAELAAPRQTFLNLTKRADRMASLTGQWMCDRGLQEAPRNMWMGFSAENQEWFNKRWDCMQLLNQFDFTLWVSAEPLLGPIVLPQSFLSLEKKAWCIVGGESGARARSMRPEWATDLRDQCVEAGVPYFFKQWGMERPIAGSDWDDPACNPKDIIQRPGWPSMRHFQTKDGAGYLLDGQEWSQFPDSSILYAPQRGESLRESSEFTTLV